MRVGVSIIKQLSTAFYSRKSMVLEELITNSYDAGASYAKVNVSPEEIKITDDGSGMSPDELTKFFYISFTEKNKKPLKEIRDKLKRYIIGKFGIGKLSMYQLCRRFRITTSKDGIESESTFDFDEFEKREFVDEIELNVSTKKTDPRKHGTEIVLEKLRPGTDVNPIQLRRALANRLFLNPDFKIFINDTRVASAQDIEFLDKYAIKEELPKVGPVTGEIKFLKHVMRSDEAGVYVRVRGRVINQDPRIIDYARLNSPNFTGRRIWGILDVDGLEDAVQSNRSDFIKDNPKYEIFVDWLYIKLLDITSKFMKTTYHNLRTAEESVSIPEEMQRDFNSRVENFIGKTGTKDGKSEQTKTGPEKKEKSPSLQRIKERFELADLGSDGPEAGYDSEKKIVTVNTEHPMYKQARRRKCLEYHVMIATIVTIAAHSSHTIKEFLEKYEGLVRAGEIPKFKKDASKKIPKSGSNRLRK